VLTGLQNISGNKPGIGRHFGVSHLSGRSYSGDMESSGLLLPSIARVLVAGVIALFTLVAHAADATLEAGLEQQVRDLAAAGTQHAAAGVTRVDIQVGQLDARLRLAPCQRVEPYLPPSTRLWGKTRIGLRCVEGPSHWNVFLPITVRIYGQALVATVPMAVGSVVAGADVTQAEVDLAEDASMAMMDAKLVIGRTVARAVNAGQSLRLAHLKPRQWFAAGETVTVVTLGPGFSVAGLGQALTPGMEGQTARVKTESGRVLTGMPVGERRLELSL
jgi:flagella basal body P-ring formation protein FlgA